MGSKDDVKSPSKVIKDTIEDAKDATSEMRHRTAAEGEKVKRELAGSEMTVGEKLGSAVNEGKERTQAEIDAAKRHLRDAGEKGK